MEDFNIRKFLTENKLTVNTKTLKESDESEDVKSTEGGSLRDQFLAVGTSEEVNQYTDSLKKDLELNGRENYEGWTKSDFVEDFKNYLADKGLDEDVPGFGIGGNHKDNPILNAVDKGVSKIGKYADKFHKAMEPWGKGAASAMRESGKVNPYTTKPKDGEEADDEDMEWNWESKIHEMEIDGEGNPTELPKHMEDEYQANGRWEESEDPELLDRLNNLANKSDFKEFQDLLRIVGSEWMNEDFTKEEIKSMLNFLVDEI